MYALPGFTHIYGQRPTTDQPENEWWKEGSEKMVFAEKKKKKTRLIFFLCPCPEFAALD